MCDAADPADPADECAGGSAGTPQQRAPTAAMKRDLRALSADLTRLALGAEEVEQSEAVGTAAEDDEDDAVTSGASSSEDDQSFGYTSASARAPDTSFAAVSSSDESRFGQAASKAIDDLGATLSSGLTSLLGAGRWPTRWSWTDGAALAEVPSDSENAPPHAPPAPVSTGALTDDAPAAEAGAELDCMTSISLEAEVSAAGATASAQDAAPDTSGGVLEASLEQGGMLLQEVGRRALSLLTATTMVDCPCPCPTPGAAGTIIINPSFAGGLYAGDAEQEAEDEDERARGGGNEQPGEPPSFDRMFALAGGAARLDELDELSTGAAQAAIRARACMLEADRSGYDATLANVRAALGSLVSDDAAGGSAGIMDANRASVPLPDIDDAAPAAPARTPEMAAAWSLALALSEARAAAESVVLASRAAFDAELAAADAETQTAASSTAAATRSDDARCWRGCEGVSAQTLERLHARGTRRLAEACAAAVSHLRALAASVTERDATLPDAPGDAWPTSAADKALLVAARATTLNAELQQLRDVFSSALARVVAHVDAASLEAPAARLRTQAKAYNGALHASARAATQLLARSLRHLTYIVVAAHLHGALERSMAGGGNE